MTDSDFAPNTRAEEAAREAALMRASQMAVNLGNVARGAGPRDGSPRLRGSGPMPPAPSEPRRRHRFLRFLVTVGLGVAGTLALQTYGGEARRYVAAQLPELSARVPALAPLIAQLPPELLTPSAGDNVAASTTAAAPTSAAPAVAAAPPPPSPEVMRGLETVARELVAMRYGMERLTAAQSQMGGAIARLQAEEEARRAAATPPPKPAPKPAPRPAAASASPAPLPLTSQSTSAAAPPRRPATIGP